MQKLDSRLNMKCVFFLTLDTASERRPVARFITGWCIPEEPAPNDQCLNDRPCKYCGKGFQEDPGGGRSPGKKLKFDILKLLEMH